MFNQNLGFSYFEFKIRLIRLSLSFQKQNFLYSNSQLTDSQSGVMQGRYNMVVYSGSGDLY